MISVPTQEEVTQIVIDCIDAQFPKDCPNCGRRFSSLAEYLRQTTHTGLPISQDAEQDNWMPTRPLGTHSLANCPCGSTLAIGTRKMSLATMWRLLKWAKIEARKRKLTTSELLESLRIEIDKRALASPVEPGE
jgi:hypothetical protein